MRNAAVALGSLVVVTLSSFIHVAGCYSFVDDCDLMSRCPPSGGGGGGGGDGGVNTACVPSENTSPVAESCGVFVSSSGGDDSNTGTPSAPVRTLAKALELAGAEGKPVYACAEVFDESVSIEAGAVLYGGLDCTSDWQYVGATKKTSIEPGADVIPVTLQGGEGATHLEDMLIKAADAMAEGGSSIATLAELDATVELVRCDLVAGSGRDGAKGATPSEPLGPNDPNDPAIRGVDGTAACMGDLAAGNPGGSGTGNPTCMMSAGGNGGAGLVTNGEDGTDGQPAGAGGLHGTGQPTMGAWSCLAGGGQFGDSGGNGADAAGAAMQELGMLSSSGFAGASGAAGSDGAPGQGGGGGGGAKGKVGCNGASGGGGGAGGCGGKGGLGGQAGGASIALVSLGATFSFTEVRLTAGNGGNGGEGGDGQGGAIGGFGGAGGLGDPAAPPTSKACSGGEGGPGGFGGKGGGGRGGHSLGIAFQGSTPPSDGVTMEVATPGQGGAGANAAGQGAQGVASPIQAFP